MSSANYHGHLAPNSTSGKYNAAYLSPGTRQRRPSRSRERAYVQDSQLPSSSDPLAPSHSRRLKRNTPPSPSVEDEKVALAKEHPPQIADVDKTDVPSRGAIDQYPIILDATEDVEQEQRREEEATARDTSTRGRTARSSRLDIPNSTPEVHERVPSPYSFTPRNEATRTETADLGYYSPIEGNVPAAFKRERAPSDALRGTGKSREPSARLDAPRRVNSSSGSSLNSRSDISGESTPLRHSRVPSQTYDYRRDGYNPDAPPRLSDRRPDPRFQPHRRSSDHVTGNNLRRPNAAGKAPSPLASPQTSPLPSRNSSIDLTEYNRSHPDGLSPSSAPSSPRKSTSGFFRDDVPHPSAHVAMPPWPTPPQTPEAIHGATLGRQGSDEKSKRASRLATSVLAADAAYSFRPRMSDGDNHVAGGPGKSKLQAQTNGGALPYPVDERSTTSMPSEDYHISRIPTGEFPSFDNTTNNTHTNDTKPSLQTRRAFDAGSNSSPATPTFPTHPDWAAPDTNHKGQPVRSWKTRRCHHSHPTKSYQNWVSLDGKSDLIICHDCLDEHFTSPRLRNQFRPWTRAEPLQKVRCAFASPWIRFAWALSVQQHRNDLDLLRRVAQVNAAELPCPGHHSSQQIWYCVIDRHGDPISHFDICDTDVKKLEGLLPFLRGRFGKRSAERRRRCALRTESHRFAEYLDLLADIEQSAAEKRRAPDTDAFVEFARRKGEMNECAHDDLLVDFRWHFAPTLPQFTVCEECYTTVVWPAIEEGSSVARRINQTPKLVNDALAQEIGDDNLIPLGTSCQLYSSRMRRIFRDAVLKSDWESLAKKAKERHEVEVDLHAQLAALQQEHSPADEDAEKIQRSYEEITEEWAYYE